MNKEPLPSLDLDEHTAKVLPPQAHVGKAQARIQLQMGDGLEPVHLLGRIVIVQPEDVLTFSNTSPYTPDPPFGLGVPDTPLELIILRPERDGDNSTYWTEAYLQLESLEQFNWQSFETSLNTPERWSSFFNRTLIIEHEGKIWVFNIHVDNTALIKRVVDHSGKGTELHIPFHWHTEGNSSPHQSKARLLNTTNSELEGIFRAAITDSNSELWAAMQWVGLPHEKQDAIAFTCKNGDWEELKLIAEKILRVRLSHKGDLLSNWYSWRLNWDFSAHQNTPVWPIDEIDDEDDFQYYEAAFVNDNALHQWQVALIEHFQPAYMEGNGLKLTTPAHIHSHINDRSQNLILVDMTDRAHLEEDTNFLISWANQNFSLERAQQLKATLKLFTDSRTIHIESIPVSRVHYSPPDTNMLEGSLTRLDLDEATAIVFPSEARYGPAQYRLQFSPKGLAEPLIFLARLIPTQENSYHTPSRYVVVLRQESAPDAATFWCELPYITGNGLLSADTMTQAQADDFDWDDFARSLNNLRFVISIKRSRIIRYEDEEFRFVLEYDGSGQYRPIQRLGKRDFFWRRFENTVSLGQRRIEFFHLDNNSLDSLLNAMVADKNSEFRISKDWHSLSPSQQEEIAFSCKNGTWDELREVARHALLLRLGPKVEDSSEAESYCWDFADDIYQDSTMLEPLNRKARKFKFRDLTFLLSWRVALVEHFQPNHIDDKGLIKAIPREIPAEVSSNRKRLIIASVPDTNEFAQSQSYLRKWVQEHLSPSRAQELGDILKMLPESPPIGKIPFTPPLITSPDLTEFWQLWREEKFWGCHEALEEVWRAETDSKRRIFLQGLIHCAVAVFQHRRHNSTGAARQWTRAKVRLEPFLPSHENIDLAMLLVGVEKEIGGSLHRPHVGLKELETRLRAETKLKMESR